MSGKSGEQWATKIGVIMAVAGSAVGIGNFLRFPGRAALYGGGVFMIPYFVSLLVIGIPLGWVEWTLGRHGGRYGFHSAPALFSVIRRSALTRVFGALAVFIPIVIFMYYEFIQAWCLGYAWDYAVGNIHAGTDPALYPEYFSGRFNTYIGADAHGALLTHLSPAVIALVLCFLLNFFLIYLGLSKGIETFCNWAMPAVVIAGTIILVRVLTLGTPDPAHPEQNVLNGLGFMWNPKPRATGEGMLSALFDPKVWLEAAGQILFTLSVGFGIIMTYASYLRRTDDVVLSSLSASATNQLSEVCLGGLITIPAAFIFLGAAPLEKVAGSSMGLGFHAVPAVLEYLPFGALFGFLWFGLLFLAATAASISMLLPAIAFLEEGLGLERRSSALAVGVVTGLGSLLVVYFSKNTIALDVMDFWVGSAMLLVLALFEVILFGWVIGVRRGIDEANRGSDIKIPPYFAFIIRYACPAYLLFILAGFAYQDFGNQARAVAGDRAAVITVLFMAAVFALIMALVVHASRRWEAARRFDAPLDGEPA
jgi:SNF family Na+-dependent transporter